MSAPHRLQAPAPLGIQGGAEGHRHAFASRQRPGQPKPFEDVVSETAVPTSQRPMSEKLLTPRHPPPSIPAVEAWIRQREQFGTQAPTRGVAWPESNMHEHSSQPVPEHKPPSMPAKEAWERQCQ